MNRDTPASSQHPAVQAALWHDQRSGIVYDADLFRKPATMADALLEVSHTLFEPAFWQARQAAQSQTGGRGSVLFIHDGERRWVLRHYRRGGLVGRVVADQYLWLGAAATRSFREWRLLAWLRAQGLPVPAPVAARYVRSGLVYRADLITAAIPGARTLTQVLAGRALDVESWRRLGAVLARFHAAGVMHADLNAHNILLDGSGGIHVLDFDRGRLRTPGQRWINTVLARLLRSLNKLHALQGIHFEMRNWVALRAAHDAQLAQLRA